MIRRLSPQHIIATHRLPTLLAPRTGERRPLQHLANLFSGQPHAAAKNRQWVSRHRALPQLLPLNGELNGRLNGQLNGNVCKDYCFNSSLQPFDYCGRLYFSTRSFSDGSFGRRRNNDGRRNKHQHHNRVRRMRDCSTINEAIEISFKNLQQHGKLSHRDTSAFWTVVPRLLGKTSQGANHTNELELANQLEKLTEHTRKSIKSFDQRCLSEIILGLAKTAEQMARNRNKRHKSPIDQVLRNFLPPGSLNRVDSIFNQLAAASVSTISKSDPRYLSNQAYACTKIGFVPKFNDGSSFFDHIANESILKMKDFDPQGISNLTWSFAKLEEPNTNLFEKIGNLVASFGDLEPFKPQELSNTVWAFATVGASHTGLYQKIGDEIVSRENLNEFKPQNLANMVWAFATTGASHTGLFQRVGNEIVNKENLHEFKPQELANTVWAFATVGASHTGFFQKIGNEIVGRGSLHEFTPQNLVNTVWAFATVGASHTGLFQTIGNEIVRRNNFHQFTPQGLANTVWAFATVGASHTGLYQKIGNEIVGREKLNEFKPQNLANMVWAFATIGEPHPGLFQKVGDEIASLDNLHNYSPQNLANIVWSYATAEIAHPDLFKKVACEIVALNDLGSFKTQNISNIAWAFATAKQYYPELFDKIAIAAIQRRSEFNPQEISNLLWAFSTVGRLNDDIFSSLAPSIEELIDKFNCQGLANIAWAYSVSNVEAPCIFNKDGLFIEACLNVEDGFTVKDLAQLHQWQLWQRELGTGVALPARLVQRCSEAFNSQRFTTSNLQKDVISELVTIGLNPEEEVLLRSGYRIDALIELHGKKVAVEIHGPSRFIGKNPTGSTILKRRQVSTLDGFRVVSLPYWKWNELGRNRENKQQYLRSKMFHEFEAST